MNAKELSESYRKDASDCEQAGKMFWADVYNTVADEFGSLVPEYRPPQPSDDGKRCFLEELPSDAPPTLVRKRLTAANLSPIYEFWTVAGWRELKKGVWPCERPEVGGA